MPRESRLEIMKLEGKVLSLNGERKINVGTQQLRVSQALFLVKTSNGMKHGAMFLWNRDADKIHELALGGVYKFQALTKEENNGLIIFFLPNQTRFQAIAYRKGEVF